MLRVSTASRCAAASAAGVLLCGLGALFAQPEPAPETPAEALAAKTFAAAIEVELLDLQVIVTDHEGRRVRGLPAEAFRILLDGEEAPIELFAEVDATVPGVAATAPGESRGADRTPVNYLVFIDDLMTLRRNRDFVLQRLRDELDHLEAGDRMAVVRLAGHRKLQVLADWTGDREVLRNVLERAMEFDALGIKYIALRRMEDFVANWEGNDTRRSILATAGAIRLLERPVGRRALLLVAGSWDPAEVARSGLFSPWCVTGDCASTGVFNVLTDTANLFGYAVYAVDVEGRDPNGDWGRETRLHSILGELARVTGGQRLLNGGRRRLLSVAAEDSRAYYSIGVTPPRDAAARRHRVEIVMLREGLEARAQTAFVPLSPERDRELDVLAALWLEEGAAETPLALRLGHVERLGGSRIGLIAHLAIPTAALTWRTVGERRIAEVTIEVASVSWRGDSSAVLTRRLRLDHPPDGTRVEWVVPWPFELPRRRHTVVAGLRDHLAGESFTVVAEISPRERPVPPAAIAASAVAASSERR